MHILTVMLASLNGRAWCSSVDADAGNCHPTFPKDYTSLYIT